MDNVKKYWILMPAFIVLLAMLYKVFELSVLEHHFIIPSTRWLPPALIAGNLIYYALKDYKWAIIINFWVCFIVEFMGFLSLFYSPTLAKTYLGPVWVGYFVALLVALFGYLLYSYQKENELFKH